MSYEPSDQQTLKLIHYYQHQLENPDSTESEITEESELNDENKYNNLFLLEAVFWRYRNFIEKFTVGGDEVKTNEDALNYFSKFFDNYGLIDPVNLSDKIAERYKEFLQNGQKLLNLKELKDENLRKRLCLVHSFVNKWVNDLILNENLIWNGIMNMMTLGLPIIDNPNYEQLADINCSNKKQLKNIAEFYINGKDNINIIQDIHRTNIKELIGLSSSFVDFLHVYLSKTKLFNLIGPENFGALEEEFAEILQIWNIEENYRWHLYKELIGLNNKIKNEEIENKEHEENEERNSKHSQLIKIELRLATSLLFKKLIKYEDILIHNLDKANNELLTKILKISKNLKDDIYETISNKLSINILVETIKLFKDKLLILCANREWDELSNLLANNLNIIDLGEKDNLNGKIFKEILKEDHIKYLSDKIEKDPELRKRLTNEPGHKIRISLLIDDEEQYEKFCDKYGLIDYKIYRSKEQLTKHYLDALGTKYLKKEINRISASLFVWYTWMENKIFDNKRGKNQDWGCCKIRKQVQKAWELTKIKVHKKYDTLFYIDVDELGTGRRIFIGWLEAQKYLMELKMAESRDVKMKDLLNNDITDTKQFFEVWSGIIVTGGWTDREDKPNILEFIKWLKIQHLIQLRDLMKKDIYVDFRKKLAKSIS
ncbi:hypothetical protein ACQ4LE_009863 [Meloidogyne hapla]